MSTKKELAGSLTPQPPLRHGRGLRLSRASQERAPKPSLLPESSIAPDPSTPAEVALSAPQPPAVPAASSFAAAGAPIRSALDVPAPPTPEREKRKIKLRKDLLKQYKRIAR